MDKYKFNDVSGKADDCSLIATGAVLILDDKIYPMIKDCNHAPAFHRARWLVKVTRHV